MPATKISPFQAADVFRAHKREIMREARRTAPGFKVGATILNDGTWIGCTVFDQASESSISYDGRGYVLYIDADRWLSYEQLDEAIDRWLFERSPDMPGDAY